MLCFESEILMMKINVRQFSWANVSLEYAENTQIISSRCNDNYFAEKKLCLPNNSNSRDTIEITWKIDIGAVWFFWAMKEAFNQQKQRDLCGNWQASHLVFQRRKKRRRTIILLPSACDCLTGAQLARTNDERGRGEERQRRKQIDREQERLTMRENP